MTRGEGLVEEGKRWPASPLLVCFRYSFTAWLVASMGKDVKMICLADNLLLVPSQVMKRVNEQQVEREQVV